MQRRARLQLITDLLAEEVVEDQPALRELLASRGVEVSQSSLSRDLRDLGAVRVRNTDGAFVYRLPAEPPAATSEQVFRNRFATSVTGVRRSGFVVLVLTPPGEAQLVGRLLDQVAPAGLLGTVAGDDTVILVAETPGAARRLERELAGLLE
jgi:transcriptional regulator of arginine metabolism